MKQRHGASRLGGLLKRRLLPAILSLSMAVSLVLPGVAAAAGGFGMRRHFPTGCVRRSGYNRRERRDKP